MNIIAIDPSINETGWACADQNVQFSGVIKTKGKIETEKIRDLCIELSLIIQKHDIQEVIVEIAEGFTYQRSANMYGKAMNAGSMYKNGMAAGAILALTGMSNIKMETVGATFWKGKMGKKMAMMMTQKTNNNEADAIMLLRWYLARRPWKE